MNNTDIKTLSRTISLLNSIDYPDSLRVANEIILYTQGDIKKITEICNRLAKNEPWEYVRGWGEFCGMKIEVNEKVLIPRVETEKIIDIVKSFERKFEKIIDVGTGSGAISIALKRDFPTFKIIGVDIDENVLKIAKKNTKNNNAEVEYIKSDLLTNLEITSPTLVIANLPYIPTEEIENLQPSVKEFEPILALDGGKDGLEIIRRLIEQINENENMVGAILEIDPTQKEILTELMSDYKFEFIFDSFGLLRFLKFYRKS